MVRVEKAEALRLVLLSGSDVKKEGKQETGLTIWQGLHPWAHCGPLR